MKNVAAIAITPLRLKMLHFPSLFKVNLLSLLRKNCYRENRVENVRRHDSDPAPDSSLKGCGWGSQGCPLGDPRGLQVTREAVEPALPNPRRTRVPGTLHGASWVSVRPLSRRGPHEVLTVGDDLNVPPDKENLESRPDTPSTSSHLSRVGSCLRVDGWRQGPSDPRVIFTRPTRLRLVSGDATQRLACLCVRNSTPWEDRL